MAWAPDYLDLPATKKWLRIADADDDTELAVFITATSRAIDEHCNRQFGKVTDEARRYTARFDYERCRWVVDIDDLAVTPTSVSIVDTTGAGAAPLTVAVADVDLEPVNALAEGKVYTSLVIKPSSANQPTGQANEMSIVAPWGWPTIPTPVTLAARLQVGRFNARRDSPYGVAGSPSDGSELRLLARLDPDVAVSLRGLVRPRKVA